MPGSGTPLLWNENAPAETDIADAAPIRSIVTSLRNGLAVEHSWPNASAPNFGYHLLGSCRPYYDIQSNVSSAGTDGRLMVTSDTSRMFHVGSAGTMFLGGANVPSVGSAPVGGQRFYWAMEFGQAQVGIGATTLNVTIPNSGYSGLPFVWITALGSGESRAWGVAQISTSVFQAATQAASSNLMNFFWLSIGTRTF